MTDALAPVLQALRAAHPGVASLVDELNAPSANYPVLSLSPSAEFLLLSVGAALETPGRHVVIFPAKHADYRVECFRAALRAASIKQENVVLVSRAASGVEYAVAQERKIAGRYGLFSVRDLDAIPDASNIGGIGPALVDLDSLDREVSLGAILQRLENARSVVLVTTRTESRAVSSAAKRQDLTVVGLTRSQLVETDGLPDTEAQLGAGWDWVPEDKRQIPPTLNAVDKKLWMKSTWWRSRHWRSAVYRGLATTIARRDLLRWIRVSREVVLVRDAAFETPMERAATQIAQARIAAKRSSDLLSDEQHALVDLASDIFYRLRALTVPTKSYDKMAEKQGTGIGFASQLRLLDESAQRMTEPGLGDPLRGAAAALSEARLAIENRNAKTSDVTSFLHGIIETRDPLTIVVSDDIEAAALYAHIESFVKWGGTERPTRAKLASKNVAIIPSKALRTFEARGRIVLANLPPYWLAREAYLRGADRVTAVVYGSERDRYSVIQARDRIVESFLFPAQRQAAAVTTLVGQAVTLPDELARPTPLDGDAQRALQVAKAVEAGPVPAVYDSTEFFADEDAFSRAMRQRAVAVASEKAANTTSALPRGSTIEGVRVWFTDGTYFDCEEELSVDCVPEDERTQSVKRAGRLRADDFVLIGEGNASVSTIVSIAGRLQAKSARALETVEANGRWRIAIDTFRTEHGLTWAELHERCAENGYSNKTPWTLMSYAAPWVWLPDHAENFEAILKTISPDELYRERAELWKASMRLRRISGRLKSLLKAEYKRRAAKKEAADDSMSILDEEWGVTLSDFEDLFEVKKVDRVEKPVSFRNADRGRVKRPTSV